MVTAPSLLSGAGSGVQLAGGGPGGGRRRGLPRVPLHRIRERTHQEASRQPRRLHTDQSAAGLLPGKGGEEKNNRCLSVAESRGHVCLVCSPVGPNIFPQDFVNSLLCLRRWFGSRPAVLFFFCSRRAATDMSQSFTRSPSPREPPISFPLVCPRRRYGCLSPAFDTTDLLLYFFYIFLRCCSVIDKTKTNKNENAGVFFFKKFKKRWNLKSQDQRFRTCF